MRIAHKATLGAAGVTFCATALVGAMAVPVHAAGDDNGVADRSAQEIRQEAQSAFKQLSSVHVEAEFDAAALTDVKEIDLSMDREGNCAGTVEQEGGSFELIRQGDRLWIQPDKRWLESELPGLRDDAERKLLDGKYVEMSVRSKQGAKIAPLCDLNRVERELGERAGRLAQAQLTKGDKGEVDGTPAIKVSARADNAEAEGYVATEGKPYPLKVSGTAKGQDQGRISISAEFSDFDKPVRVTAPPASDTINAD